MQMPTNQTTKDSVDAIGLIDQIFLLSPKTKAGLKEAWPMMFGKEKKEFLDYLNSIIDKQDGLLKSLVQNNANFMTELGEFKNTTDRNKLKRREKEVAKDEEMDIEALETVLKNL